MTWVTEGGLGQTLFSAVSLVQGSSTATTANGTITITLGLDTTSGSTEFPPMGLTYSIPITFTPSAVAGMRYTFGDVNYWIISSPYISYNYKDLINY